MTTMPPAIALPALNDALWSALEALGARVTLKSVPEGRYLRVGSAVPMLLGWRATNWDQLADADLIEGGLAAAVRAADQQCLAQGQGVASLHQWPIDGNRRELHAWRHPVADADGRTTALLTVWTDPSETRQREQQLSAALGQIEQFQRQYQALRDAQSESAPGVRDTATGLYQREHFDAQIEREIDLSSREQREFSVVYVEIDAQDDFTARHGLAACASLQDGVGRLLRANTRAMDAPCRLSPGRYAILLSGCGLAAAHTRIEGMRKQCESMIVVHEGRALNGSVTMGVASFPHTADSAAALLAAAEAAMQEARRRGGNRVGLAAISFAPKT